jgi:IS30 family transposase
MKQGQAINCIMANHKNGLMIGRSTLDRYIDACLFTARNLDLPRKVRFARRKKKLTVKINNRCREGRTYEDFNAYMLEHPGTAVTQLDTVEGTRGGKVLLTVHIVSCELMLMFLRDYNDSASVTACIDQLYQALGQETFCRLFPVFLADNGSEFSDPLRIECDWSGTSEMRSKLFYCDPSAPFQKGSCERNHEFIREIIPKGTSLDEFNQKNIDLIVDHISSYPRPGFGNKTPYEMFSYLYGEDILKKLGIHRIDPDDVTLRPSLMRGRLSDEQD